MVTAPAVQNPVAGPDVRQFPGSRRLTCRRTNERASYLSETFVERPLTAIRWTMEQVTAMVGSMVVPEGE
jgi:hypothetical protein